MQANVLQLFNEGTTQQEHGVTFDDFWLLYPRRVAKLAARKAWARVDPQHYVEILTALVAWRPIWAQRDSEYLPHPASWLNGERWTDELPSSVSHASHVAAPSGGAPPQRGVIPPHVQAALDRMKAKSR